jgi:putative transcriptional regulator
LSWWPHDPTTTRHHRPLTVQNEIRRLRTDRGLSQAALGEALGVSRQTVNSLEAGRYDPSLPLALHLGRYFGLPVEELFHLPDAPASHHG